MTGYRFLRDYNATVHGVRYYIEASAVVDLTEAEANAIIADAPGVCEVANIMEPNAGTRAPDAPAHDRQVKRAPQKRAVTHE